MDRDKEFKIVQKEYEALLKSTNPQKRGRDFEKVLAKILELDGLQPRTSYRPKGEEIDGSFFWSGQTFLLEAKWIKNHIPASSIYSFKGKLDGKFHTTSGVFISMSGYGPETVDALRFGKTLNIILFDKDDIDTILIHEVPFVDVLKFKLRQAGDTGNVLVPYSGKQKSSENSSVLDLTTLFSSKDGLGKNQSTKYQLLIFVEGKSDMKPIANLMKSLPSSSEVDFEIVQLDGVNNIRKIPDYLSLYNSPNYLLGTIVILDEDQNTDSNYTLIENTKERIDEAAIWTPNLFLFISEKELKRLGREDHFDSLQQLYIYRKITSFVTDLIDDFEYDPVEDIPYEAMVSAMTEAEWDYKNKMVVVPSDDIEGYSDHEIKTLSELVEYIDEVSTQAMHDQMPRDWLEDMGMLDYSTEAQEFLIENYQEEMDKMGWTDADW